MSDKPLLLFSAPVGTRSGYGDHARDLCRVLIESERYDVKILDQRWGATPRNALNVENPNHKIFLDRMLDQPSLPRQPEIYVTVSVPNEFQPIGRYNIGITAGIESTMCSAQWIEGLNRMDLNIVPSNHSKEVFSKTIWKKHHQQTNEVLGQLTLQKPVEVLFEGVNTDIFKKTNVIPQTLTSEMKNIKSSFNYLFVGHWLKGAIGQDRKDVGMLIKVFLETFKNQKITPGLILKTSSATFSKLDKLELEAKIFSIIQGVKAETLPPLYLIHGQLTDEEMNALYNHPKVKAHITFTKGEGFGRPLLEASLSGKPVIASGWSGQLDFLSRELSILLPGQLTPIHESAAWENVLIKESQWFTVNYGYASHVLKEVFNNYKKYEINAKKLAMINESKFSYKKMNKEFLELLDRYVPKFKTSESVSLPNLPKLNKIGGTQETPNKIEMPTLKSLDDAEEPTHGSGDKTKEIEEKIEIPKLKLVGSETEESSSEQTNQTD